MAVSRNRSLNVVKAFAAFGIVMIHYSFPGIVGKVIYGLSKFALPFFIAIAGYYTYSEDTDRVIARIPRKIKYLFKVWIITDAVYFLLHFILNGCSLQWAIKELSWSSYRFFNLVFFQLTWAGFTWYILALLVCYALCYFVAKHNLWKKLFWLIPVMYGINLFLGEIVPFLRPEGELPWYYCANLFVLTIPSFLLGVYIRMNEEKLMKLTNFKNIVIGLVAAFFINMAERYLTHASQLFFSNIITTIILLCMCIKYPVVVTGRKAVDKLLDLLAFLGEYSLYIYLIHPGLKEIAKKIRLNMADGEGPLASWLAPLLVLVISTAAAYAIGKYKTRVKTRGGR